MAKSRKKPGTPRKKAAPKPPAPETFTAAEQRFIAEYLIEPNATRAYRIAHPHCTYATARSEGSKYLAKPNIKNEIAAGRKAQRTRSQVAADAVIEEARRLAFSDLIYCFEDDGVTPRPMNKIPPETRRAIASVKVKQERIERRTEKHGWDDVKITESTKIIEYKFWPKPKGIDKLWLHLGLNQEIMPLDALLAVLPPKLAEQVRAALAGALPSEDGEADPRCNKK